MNFTEVSSPVGADGERVFCLETEPCAGEFVAVKVDSDIQLDGGGHYVARTFKATGRWIDGAGAQKLFPGRDIPVTATTTHTNYDGSAIPLDSIEQLLDGMDGKPKPLPSPIRRAISAAQSMAAQP